MSCKFIYLFIIFCSSCVFSSAQGLKDSTRIISGKTYLFTLNNADKYIARVLNQDDSNILVNAKKNGIIQVHRSSILRATEVEPKALKERGLPCRSEVKFGFGWGSPYAAQAYGLTYNRTIYTLGYRYSINRFFSVGIDGSFDWQVGKEGDNYLTNKVHNVSFAPVIEWCYWDRHKIEHSLYVKLYGSASMGIRYSYEENDTASLNSPNPVNNFSLVHINESLNSTYQLTPIGIRVGRSFALYAELGYGYKGRVNCGLDIRFHKRISSVDLNSNK